MKASNKWGKREEKIAKMLQMKRQAMSGAGLFDKEDLVGHNIKAQLKSTEGDSIRMHKSDVQKLFMHSNQHEKSMFLLDFVNGPFLVCVPLEHLVEITRALLGAGVISVKTEQDEIIVEETTKINLDDVF